MKDLYHIFWVDEYKEGSLSYCLNLTEIDVFEFYLKGNGCINSIITSLLEDGEVGTIQDALYNIINMPELELTKCINDFMDSNYSTFAGGTGSAYPKTFFVNDKGMLEQYYYLNESLRQVVREKAKGMLLNI